MIPARFDYAAPDTIDEAIELLQRHGEDAKVLTGGHSLVPMMKLRLARPGMVIDLRKIGGLRDIRRANGTLEIGAAATHAQVMDSQDVRDACELLCETAGEIGDVQVRNAGTIGGSVVHADPAADWPAALLACGATMVLRGPGGERAVAAEDFFLGLMESAARPDEILTTIRVPASNGGGAYRKLAQSASGFALAGVAASVILDGGAIASARVGITGVSDRAYRPQAVETALAGCAPDEQAVADACQNATEGVEALADVHASARYRENLARVLTRRAVLAAAERARGSPA